MSFLMARRVRNATWRAIALRLGGAARTAKRLGSARSMQFHDHGILSADAADRTP